jgi:hypothetical protein
MGLCRPCQGSGFFEFESFEERKVASRTLSQILEEFSNASLEIQALLKEKSLIDKPKRYYNATKAAMVILQEIADVKSTSSSNINIRVLEQKISKIRAFHDELRRIISTNLPDPKPIPTRKTKLSKIINPNQLNLF